LHKVSFENRVKAGVRAKVKAILFKSINNYTKLRIYFFAGIGCNVVLARENPLLERVSNFVLVTPSGFGDHLIFNSL
jgi:hypothetical protein